MSVRQGLLTILSVGASYGYQLRAEFERRTGGSWPLNIGQVYTTLERLERDGLVVAGEPSDEGQRFYTITERGSLAVREWLSTPVPRTATTRDELPIKIALAVTTPGIDVGAVIQTQRTATLRTMQELTRMKIADGGDGDLAWSLVLESMIFAVEAEIRWLDFTEAALARSGRRPRSAANPAPAVDVESAEVAR